MCCISTQKCFIQRSNASIERVGIIVRTTENIVGEGYDLFWQLQLSS